LTIGVLVVSEKLKTVIDAVGGDMYLISINALNRATKNFNYDIVFITNMKNK
jgi:hypothetical protein